MTIIIKRIEYQVALYKYLLKIDFSKSMRSPKNSFQIKFSIFFVKSNFFNPTFAKLIFEIYQDYYTLMNYQAVI